MEAIHAMGVFADSNGVMIQNKNKISILNVAINLFSQNGYNAVSIRDITREVGIKESSLYNHFKSKAMILETIYYNFRMDIAKIIPPLDSLDSIVSSMNIEAFLTQGFNNFLEHIQNQEREKMWRIMYLEQVRDREARAIYLDDIVTGICDYISIVFEKYMELKQIPRQDPKMLSINYQYPLLQMVNIYILKRLNSQETNSTEQMMKAHIQFFLRMIQSDLQVTNHKGREK